MKVKITRIDKELPLPEYKTKGSVGCDLYARVNTTIPPKQVGKIPANVIVQTPKGYMLMLTMRSSTPSKKGLSMPHGLGTIDQDYSGPDDELIIQVYNFTDTNVIVERGERVAQMVFVPIEVAEFEEVEQVSNESRGGFGSTGAK